MRKNVEYNIISVGTERETESNGYISVSEIQENGMRVISPLNHYEDYLHEIKSNLFVSGKLGINNLAILRFQLISSLGIPAWISREVHCVVVGAGALGFSTILELKRRGFSRISLLSRREQVNKSFYAFNIEKINKIPHDCDIIIECSGSKKVNLDIIETCGTNKCIIFLGTLRRNVNISIGDIHKRNLQLIGGHELTGISSEKRQERLDVLEEWHLKNNFAFEGLSKVHANFNQLNEIYNHEFEEVFHIVKH